MSDHSACTIRVLTDYVDALKKALGDGGFTYSIHNQGPRYALFVVDSATRLFSEDILDPLTESGARFEAIDSGCPGVWYPWLYVAPGGVRAYECLSLESSIRPIVRVRDDGAIEEADLERAREYLAAHQRFQDQLTVMGEMKEAISGLSGDMEEDR